MGGPALAHDYGYIIDALTSKLIRNLWDEDNLKKFTGTFLHRPAPRGTRPIVGIGLAQSDGPLGILQFLSTVQPEDIDMKQFLLSEGLLVPFQLMNTGPILAATSLRSRLSPGPSETARGGDEIRRRDGPTGTFGCLVDHASGSAILTCHHVLASVKEQQARNEVMWSGHRIGMAQTFEPIVLGANGTNEIDAALCKPDDVKSVSAGLRTLGAVSGYLPDPPFGLPVKKEGAASGVTSGAIRLKKLSAAVMFEGGDEAVFVNQLGIIGSDKGRFAVQGDSGAVIINEKNSLVGLLSAVSAGVDLAYASPIEPVVRKLVIRPS